MKSLRIGVKHKLDCYERCSMPFNEYQKVFNLCRLKISSFKQGKQSTPAVVRRENLLKSWKGQSKRDNFCFLFFFLSAKGLFVINKSLIQMCVCFVRLISRIQGRDQEISTGR